MKTRLSDRALAFLKREQSYLAKFDKRVALAVVRQIKQAVELIGDYPHVGPAVDGAEGIRRSVTVVRNQERSRATIRRSSLTEARVGPLGGLHPGPERREAVCQQLRPSDSGD